MKHRPTALGTRLVVTAALALVGCGPAPSATSPMASVTPDSTEQAPTGSTSCEPINLTTTSGQTVDLTGTWRGGQTVVYVRQEASCVWWMALSDWPGEALGARNMIVFRGNIYPDFTLRGDWMNLVKPTELPLSGSTTFKIETDVGGATEAIVLRSQERAFATLGEAGPYAGVTLIYVGPLPSDGLP